MARQLPLKKTLPEKPGLTRWLITLLSKLPWFYNLRIASKLSLGFSLLVLITMLAVGLSYRGGANTTTSLNRTSEVGVPALVAINEAQANLLRLSANMGNYLATGNKETQAEYERNRQTFTTNLAQIKSLLPIENQAQFTKLEEFFTTWSYLSQELANQYDQHTPAENLVRFQTKAMPLANKMAMLLSDLTNHQQELVQFDLAAGRANLETTNRNMVITGLVALILGIFLMWSTHTNIAAPLRQLKEAAIELAKGDLTVKTTIESGDETGQLAEAMNTMTERLRNLIDTLEERVQGRTQALQTSAEISRNITSILNQDDLLEYIVNRIRSEFDFYHVQVYLVDEESGDLVMVKGSGEVGEKLEAKQHRLREGQGIVGTVAFMNEQFLSNNVDEVLNFVRNPLLLETQSELALPLRKGDKVLGVLDIQSEKVNRFSHDDIALMQSIADQIAVTIANAGVYQDLEEALVHQYDLTMSYSRFVPREILYFLGKKSIVEVKLGDQIQQEMTVLFSDIRSFTSLSEQMTPQENFNFINDYLSRVGPIIRKHNGFIDKYIGDAVMALFPKRAEDAVDAAIAMQNAVGAFNIERVERGLPTISIAIGLHTGNVMLGTVGEAERMEGTVISDAVNLASRMEGLTKIYKASIVVSEHTLSMLGQGSNQYNVRFLDRVQVKGKKEAVSVFEILDGESERLIALKLKTRPDFETALFHYQYRKFAEAKKCFEKVLAHHPEDEAAALYLHRINYFLEYGVPVDWTGVVVLAEK